MKPTTWILGLLVAVVSATTLLAQSDEPANPQMPPKEKPLPVEPHFEGTIAKLDVNDEASGSFLLVRKDQDRPVAKVRITRETTVVRLIPPGEFETVAYSDLKEGQQAKVWHTGPIAKSMPPICTAKRIAIVPEED